MLVPKVNPRVFALNAWYNTSCPIASANVQTLATQPCNITLHSLTHQALSQTSMQENGPVVVEFPPATFLAFHDITD